MNSKFLAMSVAMSAVLLASMISPANAKSLKPCFLGTIIGSPPPVPPIKYDPHGLVRWKQYGYCYQLPNGTIVDENNDPVVDEPEPSEPPIFVPPVVPDEEEEEDDILSEFPGGGNPSDPGNETPVGTEPGGGTVIVIGGGNGCRGGVQPVLLTCIDQPGVSNGQYLVCPEMAHDPRFRGCTGGH